MNAWARKLSIALSILGILWALSIPAIMSLYLEPRIEKWEKDFVQAVNKQLKDQNLPPPPNPRPKSPAMSAIGSLFMPSLVAIYSIVMLGFMLRPQVAMAFSGQGRQGADLEGESLPLGGEEKPPVSRL
jgi:hypothetical protein